MSVRRWVGANEWRNKLGEAKGLSEQMAKELAEMGQLAPTVEMSRRFTKLVGMTSQVSVITLELQNYRERNHEPTTTTPA